MKEPESRRISRIQFQEEWLDLPEGFEFYVKEGTIGTCFAQAGEVRGFFNKDNAIPDVIRVFPEQEDIFGKGLLIKEDFKLASSRRAKRSIDINLAELPDEDLSIFTAYRCIVLVLESPHSREYIYDRRKSRITRRGPAQGKTGDNIDLLIKRATERTPDHPLLLHPLIICNPVPWQASMHYIHNISLRGKDGDGRRICNTVWRSLWDKEEVQRCFNRRIIRYKDPLVINACTNKVAKGQTQLPTPRECLRKFLDGDQKDELNHPSTWKIAKLDQILATVERLMEEGGVG